MTHSVCDGCLFFFFFFNATATTEIYTYWNTLSLPDALPIYRLVVAEISDPPGAGVFPHRVDLALEVRLSRGRAAGDVGQVDHVGTGRGQQGDRHLAEDDVLGEEIGRAHV